MRRCTRCRRAQAARKSPPPLPRLFRHLWKAGHCPPAPPGSGAAARFPVPALLVPSLLVDCPFIASSLPFVSKLSDSSLLLFMICPSLSMLSVTWSGFGRYHLHLTGCYVMADFHPSPALLPGQRKFFLLSVTHTVAPAPHTGTGGISRNASRTMPSVRLSLVFPACAGYKKSRQHLPHRRRLGLIF